MKKYRINILLITFAFIPIFSSCRESTEPTETNLRIYITDSPLPLELVARADVEVDRIEIKKSNESLGEPFVIVMEENITINLLDLRNGIKATLADIKVPANTYKLIRLYVASAKITLTNGETFDLVIPPDKIEIFIKPDFEIRDDKVTELIIDFNLEKSFELEGDPKDIGSIKGFKFHPVIRAVNIPESGLLKGIIKTESGLALKNASVWLKDSDTEIMTFTDKNGSYTALGVPPGIYDIYCSKDGYKDSKRDDVSIEKGRASKVDFLLLPE